MGISSSLGSSALLPAGLGFRNLIINGDFRINQRAFTSTTTSDAYGFDRWTILTGGGLTYSAQTFTAGNAIPGQEPINFARLATSGQSASSSYSIFTQKIESVRTCAGQPVTISFWAKASSGTPKVAIELAQIFGTSGSAAVDTYINQVTLSTSWVRYVVNTIVPSISGKTIGTANDYFGLTLWTSAGSNFNARTGSLGIQNSTIDFWGIQLEQNIQATPFEQRPIGVELALCQRYYFRYYGVSGGYSRFSSTGGSYSNTSWQGVLNFPTTMRATPSTIEFSGVGCTDNLSFDSTAFSSVTFSATNTHPNGAFVVGTGGTNINNGVGHILMGRGGATAYIGFSAEL
jgi:hypothetical protein